MYFFAYKASIVPSPPSAIGTVIISAYGKLSLTADCIISDTSLADIVPLKESGAIIIFIIKSSKKT